MERPIRLITCGSVDDGKSTLIGRLLLESDQILDDHYSALATDSERFGTQGGEVDPALLLDGLRSEREQGITIDVAYRHFSSTKRRFLIADTPGHEQYTRNMVTAASTADAAVVLIDARKGLLPQTRRHTTLVSLMRVPRCVVAVNKMDLVDWSQEIFDAIRNDYLEMARDLDVPNVDFIPVSALHGDNIIMKSGKAKWFDGPTLLEAMDDIVPEDFRSDRASRLPVQLVIRPTPDFRGFAGTISSGAFEVGQAVRVEPTGLSSTIATLSTPSGATMRAVAGSAVMVTLRDQIDIARGDLITGVDDSCDVTDRFRADLVWMHAEPLVCGRSYLLKIGTRTTTCTVDRRPRRLDIETNLLNEAETLEMNQIGDVVVSTGTTLPCDKYSTDRALGSFVVIDRYSFATLAAGMITEPLRRHRNVFRPDLRIDRSARSSLKNHQPAVVWLTGLSGAGKSTIADLLEQRLHALGVHTYLLDGDNLRFGLNQDLGFSPQDRSENIRRAGEVAALMADAGLVVIASFISPYTAERRQVRELMDGVPFVEVHVDVPLSIAEGRDTKGLYARARAGEIRDFTGIDSAYEVPESPEIRVDTTIVSATDAASRIVEHLRSTGVVRI